MEKVKANLNYMFCFVAVLGIIRNITNIFTKVAYLMMSETLDYDGSTIMISSHLASIFIIVSDLLIVASLMLSLLKNKLGVYGFATVNFLFYVISLAFYEDRLSQLPINLGVMIFQYVLFFGLLMIKRNGVRSWNVFFPQKATEKKTDIEEEQDTVKGVDEKSSHTELIDYANMTSVNPTNPQVHSMSLHTEDYKRITIENNGYNKEEKTCPISKIDVQKEGVPSQKKEKFIFVKRYATIFLGCLVLAALVTGIFWYHKTCQPEYQFAKADSLFKRGKIHEAMAIFTQLADEEDYLKAKTRLGILYVDNDSVKPNYKLGIKYLEETKDVDSLALQKLIDVYYPATSTAERYKDAHKCEKLVKEAIKKRWFVGMCYYILGNLAAAESDFSLAYYNWYKATEYNEGQAYDNLGWLYFNGNGCPKDDEKARSYWQKALKINNEDDYALYYLGILYKYGYGVDIALGKAYKFLTKSADLGNDDAKKEVADLEMHHTSAELLWL